MNILHKEIMKKGGARQVANELGVSRSAVYMWISGDRQPSEELLAYLNLRREVRYLPIKK